MHEADEQERVRLIKGALSFYETEFVPYLATVIALTEKIPDEINNQIRNAFTHVSRASTSISAHDLAEEIEKAKSHIERANRDCLKAALIYARKELDSLITDAVFYHGFLTPNLKSRDKSLKMLRKDAYLSETKGDRQQTKKLETILRETMSLSDDVRDQYRVAGKRKTRVMLFVHRWSRPLLYLLALIAGGILRPFVTPIISIGLSLFRQIIGQ